MLPGLFSGPIAAYQSAPFSMIGAFDLPTARLLADTLAGMPIRRCFVVHGEPGWDEATPIGPFTVFDVRPGSVRRQKRDPAHYGTPRCLPSDLEGGDAASQMVMVGGTMCGQMLIARPV